MVFQLLLSMFQIPRFCVPVDEASIRVSIELKESAGLKRVFDCIN